MKAISFMLFSVRGGLLRDDIFNSLLLLLLGNSHFLFGVFGAIIWLHHNSSLIRLLCSGLWCSIPKPRLIRTMTRDVPRELDLSFSPSLLTSLHPSLPFSIMADHSGHDDRVLCHACGAVWLKLADGLTCPHCQSDFTEIVRYSVMSPGSSTNSNVYRSRYLLMMLHQNHISSVIPHQPIHGNLMIHGRKKICREPTASWALPRPAPHDSLNTLTDHPMADLYLAAPPYAGDSHPAKQIPSLISQLR